MKSARPRTVAEYIARAPVAARRKLRELRACIRAAAPGAREALKWGMPAFTDRRILVAYAGFASHVGLYPTPSAVKAFKKDLAIYKTASNSINFPLEKRLPVRLIKKIIRFRVRETRIHDAKWRS